MEMPRYKSHKTVSALEIASITHRGDGGVLLTFREDYESFVLAAAIIARYTPVPGDFFIKYDDGYVSISPRKAFLEGYVAESAAQNVGLPVPGYRPQSDATVDLVSQNKRLEENTLRVLDDLATMKGPAASNDKPSVIAVDQRWLAIGRTAIEQGFMAVNRAVFKPGRVTLPGDRLPA
ncbi:MAG: hypothetical protein PS018_11520 [bacterium]|nr:hypothetical protein [bacterium]